MTTATDRTGTARDFETQLTLAAPAESVAAALGTAEGISSWWAPTRGEAAPGGTLEVASRSGSRMLELRVEASEESRTAWSVHAAPLTPEWVGTTIEFEVEDSGGGASLRFRHRGLTPQCECFDMCHEGWTNALARLVSFVETEQVAYARDSFQATAGIAASPDAVLAALRAPEAITSWWTPTTGSGEPGGTLEVSFFGGEERVIMEVQPAFENRVVWSVREAARTTDWVGTTIFFDVVEAGDGAMLYFRHQGLTPDLECFDMCHAGWTHYLASLVSFVEAGQLADSSDSFQSTAHVAAPPESVLAALRTTEGVAGWWGPTRGRAEWGGILEVSFQGGRQTIRMQVEASSERRVVWSVESAPLTPDWAGTTIMFDVQDADDGAVICFRHQGLVPELECFDMCHEGWTHYLASLVAYVETGHGRPSRHGE